MPYERVYRPTDPNYHPSPDLEQHPPKDREWERTHQVIEKHYHQNGNGNSRLNNIILTVAGASLALFMGLLIWQMQRVIDKVDAFGERITRLESKAGL